MNLPQNDRNAELEERSRAALRRSLDPASLQYREVGGPDRGRDLIIELNLSGQATGYVSHVQLKSTENPKYNVDGSVSVSVPTSNVQYLLNNVCPVYFLYIEPEDELRVAYARQVKKLLDVENPNWLTQQDVTIKFGVVFDQNEHQILASAIHQEGKDSSDYLNGDLSVRQPLASANVDSEGSNESWLRAEELFREGRDHFQAQRFGEAVAKLTLVHEGQPDRPDILQWLALCHQELNELDRALHLWQESLKLLPDSVAILTNIGVTLDRLGNHFDAKVYFLEALKRSPTDAIALYDMGVSYIHDRLYFDALLYFEKLHLYHSQELRGRYESGYCLNQLKRYPEAIVQFLLGIPLPPNEVDFFFQAGRAFANLKDYGRAIECLSSLLDIQPENVVGLRARGWSYFKLKKYELAIQDWKISAYLSPNDVTIKSGLHLLYEDLADFEKSRAYLQEVIQREPSVENHFQMFLSLLKEDSKSAAVDYIKPHVGSLGLEHSLLLGLTLLGLERYQYAKEVMSFVPEEGRLNSVYVLITAKLDQIEGNDVSAATKVREVTLRDPTAKRMLQGTPELASLLDHLTSGA